MDLRIEEGGTCCLCFNDDCMRGVMQVKVDWTSSAGGLVVLNEGDNVGNGACKGGLD